MWPGGLQYQPHHLLLRLSRDLRFFRSPITRDILPRSSPQNSISSRYPVYSFSLGMCYDLGQAHHVIWRSRSRESLLSYPILTLLTTTPWQKAINLRSNFFTFMSIIDGNFCGQQLRFYSVLLLRQIPSSQSPV